MSVIIPVYNNGRHLADKAMRSLRRSSVFDQMEIILVDDGSSDPYTLDLISRLARESPNIKTHFFPLGGSGSASRPRNQGLEMTSAPWVTYLDPDNEVINDGFAALLRAAETEGADLTIGNTVRYDGRAFQNDYVKSLAPAVKAARSSGGNFGKEVLTGINFMAISPQVLVANGDWLRSLRLQQVPGAVGQDTYFSQQMIANSRSIELVDLVIGIYYSAVANSTVNYVRADFFRKYLPLERDRAQWLKEAGLFNFYVEHRIENLFQNWYMQKLKKIPESDFLEALEVLQTIWQYYGEPRFKNVNLSNMLADAAEVWDKNRFLAMCR